MNLKEAIEKYKPDFMSVGFRRDGDITKALQAEVIRYYFKDGNEVFYAVIGAPASNQVTEIKRDWARSVVDKFYWMPLNKGSIPIPMPGDVQDLFLGSDGHQLWIIYKGETLQASTPGGIHRLEGLKLNTYNVLTSIVRILCRPMVTTCKAMYPAGDFVHRRYIRGTTDKFFAYDPVEGDVCTFPTQEEAEAWLLSNSMDDDMYHSEFIEGCAFIGTLTHRSHFEVTDRKADHCQEDECDECPKKEGCDNEPWSYGSEIDEIGIMKFKKIED